jgi:hypothetical protein
MEFHRPLFYCEVKMPWDIKRRNGKFCVIKRSDGKTEKCHSTEQKAKDHMAALYASEAKLEDGKFIAYEGVGPTLIGAAVTAQPHLRQRGKEIRVLEEEGQDPVVEIPLMRKGIFSHPWVGKMVFDDDFFNAIIKNHQDRVTDYPPILNFRHSDRQGALAFIDPDDGGRLEIRDNWLYALGPPTDKAAIELIKGRKWRYSSPEFHPDYKSNLLRKLSEDAGQVPRMITLEGVTEVIYGKKEVKNMPKTITFGDVTVSLEENEDKYILDAKGLAALESTSAGLVETIAKMAKAEENATKLEAKIAKLEKKDETVNLEDMPENIRLIFEQQTAELEKQKKVQLELVKQNEAMARQRLIEQVALTMEKARKARDGKYGYTKPFLDTAQAAMLLETIGDGDKTIKLEDSKNIDGVVNYFRNAIRVMLESGLERAAFEGGTEPDEVRLEHRNGDGPTQEELTAALEQYHKGFGG